MKHIVLLAQNLKNPSQIKAWLRDLKEEVIFEHFLNATAMEAAYRLPLAEGEPERGPLDLIIIESEGLGKTPIREIEKIRAFIAEIKRLNTKNRLAVAVMAFEPPEHLDHDPLKVFRHQEVDDLILMPLDRSLFLQKVELLISEHAAGESTFLYKEKTKIFMDFGKETWIDRLSEGACGIRNPLALRPGTFATLHCSILGEGEDSFLIGRCFSSVKHPEFAEEQIVFFTFFGIRANQLSRLRVFLRNQAKIKASGDGIPVPPMPVFSPSLQKKYKIYVVEVDAETNLRIASFIEESFQNISVIRFPSYSTLLRHLKIRQKSASGTGNSPNPVPPPAPVPIPASPQDTGVAMGSQTLLSKAKLFSNSLPVAFFIEASTLEFQKFERPLGEGSIFLGKSADELQSRPSAWLEPFSETEREVIRDFSQIITADRSATIGLPIQMPNYESSYIELQGKALQSDKSSTHVALLRLVMKEIDMEAFLKISPKQENEPEGAPNLIVLDANFVGSDVEAWKTGLIRMIQPSGPIKNLDQPNVLVVSNEGPRSANYRYRHPAIQDLVFRPVDRRLLKEKISMINADLILKTETPKTEYKPVRIPITLSKEVLVEELSEFGAQIKVEQPFRRDSLMALFSEILTGSHFAPVWARKTELERDKDDPQEKYFLQFFGLSDATLKRIRSWIRENYANKKGSGN